MTMKRVTGPALKGLPADASAQLVAKRAHALFRKFGEAVEPAPFQVCSQHSESMQTLHNHLLSVEMQLAAVATTGNGYSLIVGMLDKSRQNAINHLGGFTGAGDAAMAAHWEVARKAVALLAFINGSEYGELIRANSSSDEAIFNLGGKHLGRHAETEFPIAWAYARDSVDLRKYEYSIEVPWNGDIEVFKLDLEAFSSVLRHREMVLTCDSSISQPRRITPESQGTIAEEIRKLEDKEVAFYRSLPPAFRGFGSVAEANTPFDINLATLGINKRNSGSYVEIKLGVDGADAMKLLDFVQDHGGIKGTRKGFAEIFSGRFGMRGFNTFLGKARANSILTPMAWAMKDMAKETSVLPLNGGYLQYWVDLPPDAATRERVEKAVARRLRATKDTSVPFRPVVTLLDASQAALPEARARFILEALGKGGAYPAEILNRTDFILNFLENIDPKVQKMIYMKMARKEKGATPILDSDLEHIEHIRQICAHRRTVRDTEDLVWTLRMDDTLPAGIKAKKAEIEAWLFEFSWARFESTFRFLAERIREQIKQRRY
ncbi:MAG: hypothetical protein PHV13_01265 [Candidatus ainarchaeum sp.]|nr:hypothetical protein [Candidatus ainarchaeum sp.]